MATLPTNNHLAHERFKHAPLAQGQSSTRMVTVLPGLSKDGLVRCQLQHITFTPPVYHEIEGLQGTSSACNHTILPDPVNEMGQTISSYACLSYTWGDPQDECDIEVNGKIHAVRKNLWQFLAMATENLHGNSFWIDALSIDQKNTAEKNHQVQQMGTIYARAETIIVWLGGNLELELVLHSVNTASQTRAMDQFDETLGLSAAQISRYRRSSRLRYRTGPKAGHIGKWFGMPIPTKSQPATALNINDHEEFNILKDTTGKVEKLLDRITEHEYWSRAWITQEVLLAKNAVVVAGRAAHDLLSLARTFRAAVPYFRDNAFENLIDILLRQNSADKQGIDFRSWGVINLLNRFRNKECAVCRDRIYSLLALCTEGSNLKVDYNATEEELLRQVLSLRESSMCLCSAAVVSNALGPWDFGLDDKNGKNMPFVEVHMYASVLSSAICSLCSNWVPFTWTRKSGILFCLGALCPDTQGHIFWEQPTDIEHSSSDREDKSQSRGSVFAQTRKNNKSRFLSTEGVGLDIRQSQWSHVYLLRFTLRTLLDILQQDLDTGDAGLNACANLWSNASSHSVFRYERLRFCD